MNRSYIATIFSICMVLIVIGVLNLEPQITGMAGILTSRVSILNSPPIIDPLDNITVTEGDLVFINATASDINLDSFTINFSYPINETGYWQTQLLDNGTHTVTITAYDIFNASSELNITINVLMSPSINATELNISLNNNNQSVNLTWSEMTIADYYNIYMTDDLRIGFSNNSNITNIKNTTWTDYSANQTTKRYYKVESVRRNYTNQSRIVGKFDFNLISNDEDVNKNWISLPLNVSYDAERFIREVPYGRGISVTTLIRTNPILETYLSHTKGYGNNFTMLLGRGYEIIVNQSVNYTIVGPAVTEPVEIELISDDTDVNKNWISIVYSTVEYDAEKFISEVPSNRGISVTKLIRTNPELETYMTHTKGLGNNYTMYIGQNYEVIVNQSANYTVS